MKSTMTKSWMIQKTPTKRRIAIAMSGGVDSSVAAYLHHHHQPSTCTSTELIGLHMSNWNESDEEEEGNGGFCVQSERDATDAQRVCDALGMRLHRASFAAEYWTGVFEPFVEGIGSGLTPNPDVGCNSIVKFGAMRDYALSHLGAESLSTGHYARLWHRSTPTSTALCVEDCLADTPEQAWVPSWGISKPLLLAGADVQKDQSYFLCGVKGDSFRNVLFPLGELCKNSSFASSVTEDRDKHDQDVNEKEDMNEDAHDQWWEGMSVRDIAAKAGLPTASKRDSMGICFIGKRKFSKFISEYLPRDSFLPGDFVDVDTGQIVGKHRGSIYYTIGQGAKLSGASRKWFVAQKGNGIRDVDGNICSTVFVCGDTHHPSLYSDELYVRGDDLNWIGGEIPPPLLSSSKGSIHSGGQGMPALCRTRHLQPLVSCTVSWNPEDFLYTIRFHRPLRAITPGQTVAIYVGNGIICLGGGTIWNRGPTYHEMGRQLPTNDLHPAGINDLSVRQ